MFFAAPLSWWAAVLAAGAIFSLAYFTYRRPMVPLSATQRAALTALRALVASAIVVLLCRPVIHVPPAARGVVVPVLVDVSRSMRVGDAEGSTRIARAVEVLEHDLLPALTAHVEPVLFAVGDSVAPAGVSDLAARARRSDLTSALASIRARYRDQPVGGIVLLSDGADTGLRGVSQADSAGGPPVFAVGLGAPDGVPDREVVSLTAGDPRLDQVSVDLHVSMLSRGFDRAPFDVRVLANGRPVESRRVTPTADGSPIDQVFTVHPDPRAPTVFTVAIAGEGDESVSENNTRSVLVNPAGRPRLVLVLQGAPGYDHSYLSRVWARDPGLEIDSVVRKGRDDSGKPTFLLQAAASRTPALSDGFPATREALYRYDAVIVANVEGDYFTQAQLEQLADFVSDRGGGLLVFGGRAFAQRGLIGTPLEQVLPLELDDRRGGLTQTSFDAERASGQNAVMLTRDGAGHPIMRVAATADESRQQWAALPALAASALLGGPRPGASVLAITGSSNGSVRPLIAVQRYGRGRAMVFAGEASWRWRMLAESTDRTYEYFWRQSARWLAAPAPTPVSVVIPESAEAEDAIELGVDARDGEFSPVSEATIIATLTPPGGDATPLPLRRDSTGSGHVSAAVRLQRPGLYRLQAEASDGSKSLGTVDRWFHVGGSDREFADPRLNEGFLRRIAEQSGGRYVRADQAGEVATWLTSAVGGPEPEIYDLWHHPWAFLVIVALLSVEWILRRRWGLR
jgi:uncharacterized membrane protein